MASRFLLSLLLCAALMNFTNANTDSDLDTLIPQQEKNGKWGYVNDKGYYKIRPQFDNAMPFKDGIALISIYKKYGYIDMNGKPVINPQYDDARNFCEDMAAVMIHDQKNNEKWGYIDKTGRFVINAQFDSATDFCDGKAQVKINDKMYTINKSGEILDAS